MDKSEDVKVTAAAGDPNNGVNGHDQNLSHVYSSNFITNADRKPGVEAPAPYRISRVRYTPLSFTLHVHLMLSCNFRDA